MFMKIVLRATGVFHVYDGASHVVTGSSHVPGGAFHVRSGGSFVSSKEKRMLLKHIFEMSKACGYA
ncbi:MAG TPA: hypothetical protein VHO90_21085 [Bacteroidales bacterium]|nr:hypothetical protein [Bacteroidales bacterium]